MKEFKDINLGLCHACGTCVSICPRGSISLVDDLPQLKGECTHCGLCYESCPGIEFSYPEFNKRIFNVSDVDTEIGHYHSIYVGYATDETMRKKGSSGGVVTALLSGLLKRKKINGAIVVGMNKIYPWIPEVKVATSKEEIFNSAQSKYSIISVNEILKDLNANKGDLAFVGLPCHVHGIRKLEKTGWPGIKRIKYCIGIFCGFNMKPKATDFLIQKLKVKNKQIESLEYRGGDWPGGFYLKTKDGYKYFIEKHIYNYLNLMFVPKRCLVCPDLTNEFADLAIGDAWSKELGTTGYSTIIIRDQKGQELINGATEAEDIVIKASDKQKLKEGHAHLFLYKKKGVFIRQRYMRMSPEFGISMPLMSIQERIFNIIFFYLICFMSSDFIVKFFKYIPIALPGILSKHARRIINVISRPKKSGMIKKKDNIFNRIKMEYKYLTMRRWGFCDIGAFWDSIVDYDMINKEFYSYYRRFIDSYKLSNIPRNSYLCDICSRTGNGTLFFWERGNIKNAVCADFSERFQTICARRLKEAKVPFAQKLIESMPLPFKDEEFDVVLCLETVEHISEPSIFIKELARIVKPQGQMILSTPNLLWEPIHFLAAIFNLHHSEGPHHFISRSKLHKYIKNAGLDILKERTTVLIPAGPKFLVKLGEYIEKKFAVGLMDILGLRRIFICRKNNNEGNTYKSAFY